MTRGESELYSIGAAAKEHGPHLPMRTDHLTAEALGSRLAETADVLVWPAVGYGHYPAFRRYPGSTSVPEEAFPRTNTREEYTAMLANLPGNPQV